MKRYFIASPPVVTRPQRLIGRQCSECNTEPGEHRTEELESLHYAKHEKGSWRQRILAQEDSRRDQRVDRQTLSVN